MQDDHTSTLRFALDDLDQVVRLLRRNIGHVVCPGPRPWSEAAAAQLLLNAARAADLSSALLDAEPPTFNAARMVCDLRLIALGRQVDRVHRLWQERAGKPPVSALAATLSNLRRAVRHVRNLATA